MKKYILLIFIIISAVGCKKREDISKTADVSFPTITTNGVSITSTDQDNYYQELILTDQIGFVSLMPGAVSSLSPTGYDSLLNESVTVTEVNNGFDGNTPGLYIIDYSARNSNQYYSLVRFYTAITDIPDSYDLSGLYETPAGDTVEIQMLARGMYLQTDMTGDFLGLAGIFVQTSPTTIVASEQAGEFSGEFAGPFSISNGIIDTTSGQTVISYEINNPLINETYGTGTVFTFTKIE